MCGIACFLDKLNNDRAPVGSTIFDMLDSLGLRGPDSSGVALYGARSDALLLRVKLADHAGESNGTVAEARGRMIAEQVADLAQVRKVSRTAEYLRLELDYEGDPRHLEAQIQAVDDEIEVVSMGRSLEIVKQVGSPANLNARFQMADFVGTHGIGHTRLSTESRIDLSHSQPFWAHGYPDLAIVHNGHITNYHNMRRRYEQRGIHFHTENDSEIIGVYLGQQTGHGLSLEEAMRASLQDFDGSFSYLAATADAVGFAKDPFGLKPLVYAETDAFVAVATEEIAIRTAFEGHYQVKEAQVNEVRVWQR
jgi:glutamate synthase domain-containing protein 1